MDIHISFFEDHVETASTLHLTALEDMKNIKLDARDLKIISTSCLNDGGTTLKSSYNRKKNRLTLTPESSFEKGQSIVIKIVSQCIPSDSILEGIYRDTTPPGAPPQYMSQCQQWGFQRIMPVYDDCTAKCTMITTLEADSRYTHLISNGNISHTANPEGKPVAKPDDPTRVTITYENLIPMAPYLFIACAGTWEELSDSVTLPSGRNVRLEYLVPKGRLAGAQIPMAILKHSMLWHAETQNYDYKRDVYRTICMEKSNFGGMENVGNTTIVTDAALVDEYISDRRLEYAHGVIIHEFEHNQCGSDVTMETPFDMWLNEAFTVDVERQYMSSRFDPSCQRLDEVDTIRSPIGGPLSIEDSGHHGNIVRTGFNDPDELVDGVTYVKAAEVIRMLRLVIGRDAFIQGKDTYFSRYMGSNANTDQFFECFEEVSGRDLSQFKKQWLYTIGYPQVSAKWKYSKKQRTLKLKLEQTRSGKGRLFHLPIEIAAVDDSGQDIEGTSRTLELTGKSQSISFKDVREPAFLSLNRDSSFYGSFHDDSANTDQLIMQVKLDGDAFNRVEAMRKFTDIQRIELIKDPTAEIDPRWLELYGELCADASLSHGMKAYLLRIDELSLDRSYLPWYVERNRARGRLMTLAAEQHKDALLKIFNSIDTYTETDNPADGIEPRSLKNTALRILSELNTSETHDLAETHINRASNITDKVAALFCIQTSSHPRRLEILKGILDAWQDHLTAYTSYLVVIASGTNDDVFEQIAKEGNRDGFQIDHPSHARSLYVPMCANNKMLWTEPGQKWLTETAAKIATVNDYTASRIVSCLQLVDKMPTDLKARVILTLENMQHQVDSSKAPMTASRIDTFLKGTK
jgi:aminopeptidase N